MVFQDQERADHLPFPVHPTCQRGGLLAEDVWDMGTEYVIFANHYPTDQSLHLSDGFSVLCDQVLWQSFLAGTASLLFKADAKILAFPFFLITFMA